MHRLRRSIRAMASLLAACAVASAAAPAAAATSAVTVYSGTFTPTPIAAPYSGWSTYGSWNYLSAYGGWQTPSGSQGSGGGSAPSSTGSTVWIRWNAPATMAGGNSAGGSGAAAAQGSSGASAGSHASMPGGPANEASAARQILQWTNQTRSQHGVPAVTESSLLDKVALAKCQDMIVNHYFSDQSPTYGSPLQMQQAFGVQARTMGAENIAGAQTPQLAYFMLTASAPHLANIVDRSLTNIGVAVVPYGVYGVYVCQEFTGN